jgi:hypothetical protein
LQHFRIADDLLQALAETSLAIEGSDFDPLDPPALILFFHLAIGQSWWPAEHGTTRLTFRTEAGRRATTLKSLLTPSVMIPGHYQELQIAVDDKI